MTLQLDVAALIALSALMVAALGFLWTLHRDMRDLSERVADDMRRLSERVAGDVSGLSERVGNLSDRVSNVESRVAKVEGLLEGLRESLARRE